MADPRHPLTFPVLARSWHQAGLIDAPAMEAIGGFVIARQQHEDPPIYVRSLAAIGTMLATAFLIGFLAISELIDFSSEAALMTWGVIFLGAGIGLAVGAGRMAVGIGRDLAQQASLAGLAVGKVLFVIGAVQAAGYGTLWAGTVALIFVTVISYPVSGSSLDRLLSPYAVVCSILFEILQRDALGPGHTAVLAIFFTLLTAAAGALLLLPGDVTRTWRPLGLAALGGMGTIICILASGHDAGFWAGRTPIDPRPITAVMTLATVGVVAWAAGGLRNLGGEAPVLAIIGFVVLGLAGAPGVLYAFALLVVGHAHHDRPLKVIGILALPAFLTLWYYGRDMTFLEKSAALVASGAVLLIARAYMAWRGLDREDAR